jgi:hypothetical protein
MEDRYVIDTNVLLAASAASPTAGDMPDVSPSEPEHQEKVFRWLEEFEQSPSRIVIDFHKDSGIYAEYHQRLNGSHYGMLVLHGKLTQALYDAVELSFDAHGHAHLPADWEAIIHDRADRKMVAAGFAARKEHGSCAIAFASDTDWHGWQEALEQAGLCIEPVIPEWSEPRFRAKQKPS